ncbi:Zn-ribbon domain-containing OB-fold protein [Actinomadura sp.]|uniref:Zn-ribbon domain-containing OB-fold protein n=1 Tax=Actinomadura sp. TaxID=1989 RepID=UPI0037C75185
MTPDGATLDGAGLDPVVSPGPEGLPFWEGLRRGVLLLPRCEACRTFFFYPRALCPSCGSRRLTWEESSGRGTLYTFCMHFRSQVPGLQSATPFATCLVDLAEGPRVMGYLLGVPEDPELIECGVPVRRTPLETPGGQCLLAFRPV